jgi:hypothetical protein
MSEAAPTSETQQAEPTSVPVAQNPPDLMHDPVGFSPELSRKNAKLAVGLLILSLILFGGTFLVGEGYLHFT